MDRVLQLIQYQPNSNERDSISLIFTDNVDEDRSENGF